MKNILIGGTGFVGSSFVKSLKNNKKYKVYSPNSKTLNLEDIKSVERFFINTVDYVIHTANHHVHPKDNKSKDPNIQLKNNVTMYFNLYMQSDHYKRLITLVQVENYLENNGIQILRKMILKKLHQRINMDYQNL